MGGCASAPAVKDGRATHALQSTPPATAALPVVHLSPPPSARDTVKQAPPQPPLEDFALEGRVGSITVKRLRTGSSQTKLQMQFLTEVHDLQQQLALANANPLLGLGECAELLTGHLNVDLVAVWVFSAEDPTAAVLMAAHGAGAALLQRCVVVRCPGGAAGVLSSVSVADAAAAEPAGGVPDHLLQLYRMAGLRSIVAVPVGPPGAPLGSLLMGKAAPDAFADDWWHVRLQAVAMGLLQHVRHGQVEQMAQLLRALDEVQDPVALISVVLRSAQRYMFRATTMHTTARLALLQREGAAEALLFETPGGGSKEELMAGCGKNQLALRGDASAEVVASQLGLQHTLLASSVKQQQARFIQDCSLYMQTCARPAKDIFTRASELVSSLVVVPLLAPEDEGTPLGAVYFALDHPCEFENMQDTLLGFIHGTSHMLHNKLSGRSDVLAAMVAKAQRRALTVNSSATDPALNAINEAPAASSGSSDGAAGAGVANGRVGGAESDAARSARSVSRGGGHARLNTEAMLKLVQQEIRNSRRRTAELSFVPELVVGECLGRGGFGTVFRGYWHKVVVAVKVMHTRKNEREAMKDAVEMAVLSSVQHPNIVSVYSCLTDMVEIGGDDVMSMSSMGSFNGSMRMKFRRLQPDEDPDGALATCNILVMEFCDKGTLRDAVKAFTFHQELEGGAIGVDVTAAVDVLQDIAYAVQYLHNVHLVHGDIKLENILLKTDSSVRLGVMPKPAAVDRSKEAPAPFSPRPPLGPPRAHAPPVSSDCRQLADFGLTKILNQQSEHVVNLSGGGTVTHLAPEMFQAGSKVTTAVDAYAFGIMMYELYCRKRAYSGIPPGSIIERVYKQGLRPRFPSATPRSYAGLAEACWQTDPTKRPTFAKIAERLEQLAVELAPQPGADARPGA
ncbi:putative serine/threonine-protein kinase pats1 [Monoraphidium neglectum]|uniref:Putative serine/threonine-protein kinase pats1 n=1 Tax=Monoraphidium neglectum TaxID=145388 RepID=A0A0D2NPQ8_9CHLO|nr:putative serine/threonine-protein kinase pats1 [Monoraphidium neglectum]KIZ06401.1 putative serine/threonine-protein kinase pats1 [Monoraphidium neglectum]|eukprot:XP_013905420.1 putative serine/threonine-protein kinase pats1 [Monoraphidium neglectum]